MKIFDPDEPRPAKRGRRLPDFLREHEIDMLLADARALWRNTPDKRPAHKKARQRDWLMWNVGYFMGLRIFELCSQKIEDVDVRAGTMMVHGKGAADGVLRIPPRLCKWLAEWIGNQTSGWLFPGPHGQLTTRHARNRLKELAKLTNIPRRIHPHILRHSFCTHMLRRGAKIRAVQKAMRHRCLSSTERYAHLLPGDEDQAMRLLETAAPDDLLDTKPAQ